MAKKTDNKKKAKPAAKPVKKAAAKPAAKKAVKAAKPEKKAAKPAPKKIAKPVAKTKAKPEPKAKVTKPAPKKEVKKTAKPEPAKGKKPAGKPIDAVAKKGKESKPAKVGGKKAKSSDDDEEEEGAAEDEEEEDVDVKDDYEKNEDEDEGGIIEGNLDEAGLMDLEGASGPDLDEDDDEIPEKRGRGRRKKNEGKSNTGSMEAYIRNRPLQIDINKPLVKRGNAAEPKPFVNTEDNRTRYSDKELLEFKELILEKLREAQADYDLLKQTLSNEDNHGTDDTSPSFKLLEDGSDVMSKEETAQLASRQEKYIVNLKNALVRIENKAYGICRVTGKLIPKERLRSVPHATMGIDAKLGQSK